MINAGITIKPFNGLQTFVAPNWEGVDIQVNYPSGQDFSSNPLLAGHYLIEQTGLVWEVKKITKTVNNVFTCWLQCKSLTPTVDITPDLGNTSKGSVTQLNGKGLNPHWDSTFVSAAVARAAFQYSIGKVEGGVAVTTAAAVTSFVAEAGSLNILSDTNQIRLGNGITPGGISLKVDVTDVVGLTASIAASVNSIVAGAPSLMNTLDEISAALADDPNFATTMTTQLAGKAPSVHVHTIDGVTGLQVLLDGKATKIHVHTIADVTGLQTTLDGKSVLGHGHTIGEIVGLQTALNGKLNSNAKAVDSALLDGLDSTSYVKTASITDSVTSTSSALVGSAKAVKAAYDKGAEALNQANTVAAPHNHDSQYLGITAKAADSQLLDGLDSLSFVKIAAISDLINSDVSTTVASSRAVKLAYDRGSSALDVANTKLGATAKAADSNLLDGLNSLSFVTVANVSSSTSSTSTTTVASSAAAKAAYDRGTAGIDRANAVKSELLGGAPAAALDTLKELADALASNDGDIAGIITSISSKLDIGGKAADANLLDGLDSTAFVRTTSISAATNSTSTGTVASSSAVKAAYDYAGSALSLANAKLDINAKAADSNLLDGIDSTGFVRTTALSTSVSSTSVDTVSTSSAVKAAYDQATSALNTANTKLASNGVAANSQLLDGIDSSGFVQTGSISTSVASTSGTTVASSSAVKTAYDQATSALNTANTKLASNGVAVNSQLLDGIDSSLFLRADFNQHRLGDFTATGNITAYSDERLKTDFQVIENALDKLCSLEGVTYERVDLHTKESTGVPRQVGFRASDVEAILPEVIHVDKHDVDQIKSVAYGNMGALYVEAIKELNAKHTAKVASLEERLASLEARLEKAGI
jgi:hypothetical protein